MANPNVHDTVTLEGPLYGLQIPDVDPSILDERILAVGPQISSSQKASYDVNLLAIRTLWNARLPVHRLPTELFVDLLASTLLRPFQTYLHEQSGRLSSDHAIVKANPCFWRSIHVGRDTRWLNLALSRSGESNLFLDFSSSSAFLTAIPQLIDRRNRIEHLRFSCVGVDSLEPMVPLMSAPLPCITRLDVTIDTREALYNIELPEGQAPRHYDILEFESANLPKVTNLSLRGAQTSIPWTTSLISHLRFLDLRRCIAPSSIMSVSSFFDVLKEGQQLEELVLYDTLSSACASLPSPSEQLHAVALPRLRKAALADHVAWTSLFVSYLHPPSMGEISFHGLIDNATLANNPDLSYTSMLPPDIRTFPFLKSTTSTTMSIDPRSYRIACQGSGPTVTLVMEVRSNLVEWWQNVGEGVAHFVDLLRDAPLTELELDLDFEFDVIDSAVFDAILDAFPTIRELRVRSNAAAGEDIVPELLAHSLGWRSPTPNDGEVKVRCPNLRVLRVQRRHESDETFLPALVECLFDRADGGAPRLELLEVTVRRSLMQNWREFDTHYEAVFMPMLETYKFVDEGMGIAF
ncbi:hypothetical protein TRAPUB_5324 [Trametes pubescens]|uniref:F-box domain-containing protein n=1 Tax=Trametes pubescens TaxID=154538 RepID=A0A1M2V8X1_TRAPU|nr:hypothetical protein TRAPUB_5324 [Trametes pubescens]